jgi:hypothetical protein
MHASVRFRPLRSHLPKLLRSGAVSVVSTATTLMLLGWRSGGERAGGVGQRGGHRPRDRPSFELNRRWVWAKRGRRSVLGEVAPFVALCLAGLVASTLRRPRHRDVGARRGWSRLARTAAVGATNAGTFGSLWLCQFVLCDRIPFRPAAAEDSCALR